MEFVVIKLEAAISHNKNENSVVSWKIATVTLSFPYLLKEKWRNVRLQRTKATEWCLCVKGADIQVEQLPAINRHLISWVNNKRGGCFVSRWKINNLLECTGQEGHHGGGSRRWEKERRTPPLHWFQKNGFTPMITVVHTCLYFFLVEA